MAQNLSQVPAAGRSGVPGKGMAASAGVPGAQNAQGMASQAAEDGGKNWEQEYKALQDRYNTDVKKLTSDIDRVRSTLQKDRATTDAEWRTRYNELQESYHQQVTKDMPEPEKVQYENQRLYLEYQQLQSDYARLQQEAEDSKSLGQAIQAFTNMGIDLKRLDLSGGLRSVMESGWAAAAQELAESRQRLAASTQAVEGQTESAQGQGQTQEPEVNPPNVYTASGGTPIGKTWGDAIKTAENVLGESGLDEEAVFRAVEMGQLDPSILPGMG
jgi:hypothetical protein